MTIYRLRNSVVYRKLENWWNRYLENGLQRALENWTEINTSYTVRGNVNTTYRTR